MRAALAFNALNFNAHAMHSLMEGHDTSLNDFCPASTKRIVKQMFVDKIWNKLGINSHLIRRNFVCLPAVATIM